ncbi:hypothetical protein FIU86_20445 (plasmid) [Roseovarius sp. THAF9]|nr:hypothetical protein FIU86_20445 [Roseovarius sp. THAF9]
MLRFPDHQPIGPVQISPGRAAGRYQRHNDPHSSKAAPARQFPTDKAKRQYARALHQAAGRSPYLLSWFRSFLTLHSFGFDRPFFDPDPSSKLFDCYEEDQCPEGALFTLALKSQDISITSLVFPRVSVSTIIPTQPNHDLCTSFFTRPNWGACQIRKFPAESNSVKCECRRYCVAKYSTSWLSLRHEAADTTWFEHSGNPPVKGDQPRGSCT